MRSIHRNAVHTTKAGDLSSLRVWAVVGLVMILALGFGAEEVPSVPDSFALRMGDPLTEIEPGGLHWYLPGSAETSLPEGRTTFVRTSPHASACQLAVPRGPGALRLSLDYLNAGIDTLYPFVPKSVVARGGKLYLLVITHPAQKSGARLLTYSPSTGHVYDQSGFNPGDYTRAAQLFVDDRYAWFTCDKGIVSADLFGGEWVLYEWERYHRSLPLRKTLMFGHGDRLYFCHEGDVFSWKIEHPDIEPSPWLPCGHHVLAGDTVWSVSGKTVSKTSPSSGRQSRYVLESSLRFFELSVSEGIVWVILGVNSPACASSALGRVDLEKNELRRILCPELGLSPARSIDVSGGELWLGTGEGVLRVSISSIR
jgi:hypothetical protein